MYVNGSLGFMLQGVSQQPERVQPDGHVREQINMLSDPNTGLSSRPGSELIAIFEGIPSDAKHRTTSVGNNLVRMSSSDGTIDAIRYDGVKYTISDPDTLIGYFGDNMAYYSQDDRIYCVNRDTVVLSESTSETFRLDWGFVQALGGEFSRTYVLTMTFEDDGTEVVAEYTTPDADATGAADAIAAENIISELSSALVTALSGASVTGVVTLTQQEVMYVRHPSRVFTLSIDDQANNTIIRAGTSREGVATFADVPKYADNNCALKVRGERGTVDDDVWLVYDIPGETGTGGFGKIGVWRESVDPDSTEQFDLDTMPHALDISGTTMTIVQPEWRPRRVGNKDINPTPSFVGRQIRDIVSFQGRIAVIAGPYAIMTRTDDNLDFFRRTATTQLATDPVDIRTAGSDDSFMEWLIPYDRNLIVAASDGQFFISGINSLTSNNAAMPRSSNFEMSTRAQPVVAGQTVMLPYSLRAFSAVNEMLPTEDGTANTLEGINNVTPRYIRGEIIGMTASANAKFLGVHTDDADNSNVIYVYNFLWENNNKVQAAWHKWVLPDPIQHVHTKDNIVYIWTTVNGDTWLSAIKLDKPIDDTIGYHITGDYLIDVDASSGTVDLGRNDYKFVALNDGDVYLKGSVVTPTSVVAATAPDFTYSFPTGIPDALVAGVPIALELRPNRPIPVDWRGNKAFNDQLVVQKFIIDYQESGPLTALMDTVWQEGTGLIEIVNNLTIPAADDPEDSFGTAVKDGSLEVPWGDDAKLSSLVIQSETLKPVNIIEIRWFGQRFRKKQ